MKVSSARELQFYFGLLCVSVQVKNLKYLRCNWRIYMSRTGWLTYFVTSTRSSRLKLNFEIGTLSRLSLFLSSCLQYSRTEWNTNGLEKYIRIKLQTWIHRFVFIFYIACKLTAPNKNICNWICKITVSHSQFDVFDAFHYFVTKEVDKKCFGCIKIVCTYV